MLANNSVQVDKDRLRALHEPTWIGTVIFVVFAIAFLSLQGLVGYWVTQANYWPAAVSVLLLTYWMHFFLLAFHEASHDNLCPIKPINHFFGLLVGWFGFMSLTLYRAAHHWHHAYLSTERDEELWPFVDPRTPRWTRCLAAFAELTLGLFYTPILFLRSFLRRGSAITDHARRRQIWLELSMIGAFWTIILVPVARYGLWLEWSVAFLLPAWLAGNLQSLRKYIEHVGLTGGTITTATRSIRHDSPWWAVLSFNQSYHDVHHRYPKVPQSELGNALAVEGPTPAETPVFPTYRHAFVHLLSCLSNPKVGAQWEGPTGG